MFCGNGTYQPLPSSAPECVYRPVDCIFTSLKIHFSLNTKFICFLSPSSSSTAAVCLYKLSSLRLPATAEGVFLSSSHTHINTQHKLHLNSYLMLIFVVSSCCYWPLAISIWLMWFDGKSCCKCWRCWHWWCFCAVQRIHSLKTSSMLGASLMRFAINVPSFSTSAFESMPKMEERGKGRAKKENAQHRRRRLIDRIFICT